VDEGRRKRAGRRLVEEALVLYAAVDVDVDCIVKLVPL
jgi:hypothetical protein